MNNPFFEIREKYPDFWLKWISRSFATGSTFRMFRKGSTNDIRQFLLDKIGDGKTLAKCNNPEKYKKVLSKYVKQLQRKIKTNQGKKPTFGQAAKPVDLYVKALVFRKGAPTSRYGQKILKWAHVPLDSIVLGYAWEHFEEELRGQGFRKSDLKLSVIKEAEYQIIQGIVADAARKARVPAIWYDYYWSDR